MENRCFLPGHRPLEKSRWGKSKFPAGQRNAKEVRSSKEKREEISLNDHEMVASIQSNMRFSILTLKGLAMRGRKDDQIRESLIITFAPNDTVENVQVTRSR